MATARDLALVNRNPLSAALRRQDHESVRYRDGAAAPQSAGLRANNEVRARL
jgi:hypothetical protein